MNEHMWIQQIVQEIKAKYHAPAVQALVTRLTVLLGTIQEVAARTDSLVDQAILEEACAEMASVLDRLQTATHAQRSTS